MPGFIREERLRHTPFPIDMSMQTDHPFYHSVFWGILDGKATIADKSDIHFELWGEYRGGSFGTFSREHLVLFPLFHAGHYDTLTIGRSKIALKVKVGFLEDFQSEAGLSLYNLDVQGAKVILDSKQWGLELDLIGDLLLGIGLGIDDAAAAHLTRHLDERFDIGFSLLKMQRKRQRMVEENRVIPGITFRWDHPNYSVFGQFSFRPFAARYIVDKELYQPIFTDKIGALLGGRYAFQRGKFSMNNQLEWRYYGKTFNFGSLDRIFPYRDTAQSLWGNYIGSHIYPLKFYRRDFSQWAVFTEYEDRNVFGLTYVAKAKYQLSKNFQLRLDLDLNGIFAEREPFFLYRFYTLSLDYQLYEKIRLSLLLTNKGMNLDVHYPTFYQNRHPYLGLMFEMPVPE